MKASSVEEGRPSFASTNPLEDMGRLFARPLTFCGRLASDPSVADDWPLAKGLGFYVFATTLVSIARLAPQATLTADAIGLISEKLRPIFEQLSFGSGTVSLLESLGFFASRFLGELLVFTHIARSFCGLMLLAGFLSLAWPRWGFRRILAWTAYAHWFAILGLVARSQLLVGAVTTLFLARVTLEAEDSEALEGARHGVLSLIGRGAKIALFGLIVAVVGLSLS